MEWTGKLISKNDTGETYVINIEFSCGEIKKCMTYFMTKSLYSHANDEDLVAEKLSQFVATVDGVVSTEEEKVYTNEDVIEMLQAIDNGDIDTASAIESLQGAKAGEEISVEKISTAAAVKADILGEGVIKHG